MSIIKVLLGDTFSISLFLVCIAVLFFILLLKSSTKSSGYKFPPGPKPWPLIGNLNILNMNFPQKTMCELAEQYGPVFTFHMGMKKYVVLTGYEAVKEALVTQADDFGERGLNAMNSHNFQGKGILFGVGESWKTMRRFTLSTLRDFGMGRSTIEDRIIDEAQLLLEVFAQHQGKPFDVTTPMNSAVSNIICVLVFGNRFQYDDPQFLRLQQLVSENVRLAVSPMSQIYNAFPVPIFRIGDIRKMGKNKIESSSYFRKVYKQRKEEHDSNDVRSFIDRFIAKQNEEHKNPHTFFEEENMVLTVANLFGAGTETTSTTLRWGLLFMMKYPHIQEKVQAEIENVIGRERPPRIDDRKRMPYTDAVVHETQRFGNIVPNNLLHETRTDTTFRGYHIPKGTPVIPLLTSVLYDKTQWQTPHQFNPGHFLDAEGRFVKKDAFMPFSAGRRICVGETLAKMELFLFFTSLLQRFTFKPPPGVLPEDLDISPCPGLTSSPVPYKLCAISR
ncbi:cytochrome P450 2K1-like [Anguilla rostrata]|uniref:cytochrome P450 2K1-like n=1 Tax=Anguilla rostrata TaxID=7938 RepID=UPI0030D385ED